MTLLARIPGIRLTSENEAAWNKLVAQRGFAAVEEAINLEWEKSHPRRVSVSSVRFNLTGKWTDDEPDAPVQQPSQPELKPVPSARLPVPPPVQPVVVATIPEPEPHEPTEAIRVPRHLPALEARQAVTEEVPTPVQQIAAPVVFVAPLVMTPSPPSTPMDETAIPQAAHPDPAPRVSLELSTKDIIAGVGALTCALTKGAKASKAELPVLMKSLRELTALLP